MARDAVIGRLTRAFDDGSFLSDVARRIAIRTESQLPGSLPHLYAYLNDEIAPALERMGYEVRVHDNPEAGGGPFLIGRRIEDDAAVTVLSYGHGDVVRGLEHEWRKGLDPWVLQREGHKLYGRGIADNKGQHSILLAALAAVIAERGRLGYNSIVMFETSEEIGSPGIHAFCAAQRADLRADVLIASDGPRLTPARPTMFLGTRGAMNIEFNLKLREGGHHSGNWGGLLANPGVILAHALATIISRDGKVLVEDLLPKAIPPSVREALGDCVIDPGDDGPEMDTWWGEPGLSQSEKVFAWNTFEILAFRTGNPDNPVNAVPPRASAHCQVRYTVDVDPAVFVPALRAHLDRNGFANIEVKEAPGRSGWAATRLDPAHPWVRWAVASVHRTTGMKPAVLPCVGGSLPNDCFADVLGMPTIWIPHSYASCSQHAPNEHALAPLLREGMEIMGGIFWDMGEPGTPCADDGA